MKKLMFVFLIMSISLYCADSLRVVWGMIDRYGNEFSQDSLENVSFKAKISNLSSGYNSREVTGSSPGNSIEIYNEIRGSCIIDFSNFDDWAWRAGDVLSIVIEDHSEGVKRYWYEAYATWNVPESADGILELGFEDLGVSGSGGPISEWYDFYKPEKFIYIGIVDNNGELFDFSDEPFDNVGFECWMSGRESEIIDEYSPGSGYKMYDSLASAIYFNIYDFETQWSEGDSLNIVIKNVSPGNGYYYKEVQGVIDSSTDEDIYAGLDAVYGPVTGGGDPLVLADWVDESIKVYWGVVNAYGTEFTESDIEYVKYKAWISRNVTDVVNETDPGNSVEIFEGFRGVCVIDMNSFDNWEWQDGDRFCLLVRDESGGLKSYYEGYGEWLISSDASGEIFLGFEDYGLTGSGYPLAINTPIHNYELYDSQINIVDKDSLIFDFTLEPYDNVSFQCWISGREFDIVDQNSERSSYADAGNASVIRINTYDFQTRWNTGDTLNVSIKHDTPGLGYYTGTKKYVFTYTSTSDYYDQYIDFGFEGDPVIAGNLVEDPRTMTYNCIRTDSTGYNFIAIPYDAGYSKASDLDPDGQNINIISKFPSTYYSGYRSAVYDPYFGWINDFSVETGGAYLINTVNTFDFTVTGDSVYIPPYEFKVSEFTSFMVPLNRTEVSDNRDIWEESGFHCNRMYRFYSEDQSWVVDGASFTPDPFPVSIGMPLVAMATMDFEWPLDKSTSFSKEVNEFVKHEKNSSFPGPKPVFFHVADEFGNDFDLASSNITFKAWINNRPQEVLDQETGGCGIMMLQDKSVCYLDLKSFPTIFKGDSLIFVVQDETDPNYENWRIGTTSLNVGHDSDPIFVGFESVISGTGDPISTTEPSGLENSNVPEQTKLYQNYPNPFNPETSISFSLPKEEQVTLSVFNTKGELVKELVNGRISAGNHRIIFNASDLNSGVYYYTLETGNTRQSKKMLLIK